MSEEIVTDVTQPGDLGSLNKTPFINRSKVKNFALEFARANRGQKFSRVGLSFLERINDRVRQTIIEEVRRHPSKGKTLL